jgi:putative transcriptional regulator
MKDQLFNEFVASVREGGAILRGDAEPSRVFVVDGPHIKQLRAHYQVSQEKFAAMFGISVGTLRNWEQGRRTPEGPARVLLHVAEKHPQAVWDVVHAIPQPRRQAAQAYRTTKMNDHHAATRRTPRGKRG